jgi:mannosyltransferase OCH1-like enzyme
MLYASDIYRYENVSFSKIRIPRLIHQTYKTHDIPSFWNSTVNSVIEMNKNDFKYRRWSDIEIDKFVKQYEPKFYYKTYKNYRYQIQRVDSFRYVLMYHIGGIYIDMDNGCNRPFKDLVVALESLDPDAVHLTALPRSPKFGVDNDFLISSVNHPFYRQLISRLDLFNNNYIL